MKFFSKYIFPPVYGLLTYFTIRVLTDSVTGSKFWLRPWKLNMMEIVFSILSSYLVIGAYRRLFRWFDTRWESGLSYSRIYTEVFYVFIVNLLLQNLLLTPFVALTDDGLQLADFVEINLVPLFFALIYYGMVRSRKFLDAYIDGRMQLEKIANDQLATELKFLRAQYHPHFLFNALNTIYFQMDESVEEAKHTVEKFSELLRYQLYDQQQTVPVQREIQYLENFIELQKIRTSDKLRLEVDFDPQLNGEQIYPLLYLPLVENAFKYAGGSYRISISLKKMENGLRFLVKNDVPAEILIFKESGGIGLENLRRRLALLYPGRHSLETGINGGHFTAELILIFEDE
jgi:sensor histidine kinase YesM